MPPLPNQQGQQQRHEDKSIIVVKDANKSKGRRGGLPKVGNG